jgi:hypothetical protein
LDVRQEMNGARDRPLPVHQTTLSRVRKRESRGRPM